MSARLAAIDSLNMAIRGLELQKLREEGLPPDLETELQALREQKDLYSSMSDQKFDSLRHGAN